MGARPVQAAGAGTPTSRPSRCSIRRRKAKPWSWSAPTPFKASLTEPPIPGDATSARAAARCRPTSSTAPTATSPPTWSTSTTACREDYKALARLGVDVKGKIVIARYGGGWRGLKPKLAAGARRGRLHHLFRPADDGYGAGDTYPKGGWRPADGRAARLGPRHAGVPGRSADPGRRRDQGRQAPRRSTRPRRS